MTDWAAIRQVARERRAALGGEGVGLRGNEMLPGGPTPSHPDALLDAALADAGLWAEATHPDDPLLAGAFALLDRDLGGIFYNGDLRPEPRRFALAHELGHWWLHTESPPLDEADLSDTPMAEPPPYGRDYVSGYSPAERREVEANVFAAEFLLPAFLLREAFRAGMTAPQVAAAAGVSETAALVQLTEAVLLEDGGRSEHPTTGDTEGHGEEKEGSGFGLQDAGTGAQAHDSRLSTLDSLDESQRAAAGVENGPVLITAGPGTGKTRTLVARVLVLLERGVAPENILALTFSNKAAGEMRERLAAIVPEAARRLWIGTFHAFGLELLRRYGWRLGLPPAPILLDPVDAVALLERHLARLDLREFEYLHNPAWPFPQILSVLSRAKDELVTPEEHAALAGAMETMAGDDPAARREAAKAREVARVHAEWQRILQEEGRLDFGDLVARPVELLRACPDVLEEVRQQYRHILVDEYQDINRASAVLVKIIAGEGRGFWAVGDLKQSIYGFRGASPANLVHFERDYPQGRRLTLNRNYRSRPTLVELFGAAAGRMAGGASGWKADRPAAGDALIVAEADDETAQADGIASAVRRFEAQGVPLSGQAVLCATNAQAEALAAALEARGVPVFYLGDLFARPEVRDMLALLSLAGEGRGAALVRVSRRFPEYGITLEEARTALRWAAEYGVPFPRALRECGIPSLSRLYAHLEDVAFRGDAFTFLARYLFGLAGYLRVLLRDDSLSSRHGRLALHQLLLLARAHASRLAVPDENPRAAFLANIRRLLAAREDSRTRLPATASEIEAVRLMTIHAAKGLEFPVVFLPNLAKDMFPSRRRGSLAKPPVGMGAPSVDDETRETERLFFVALSRARDHLVLSRPLSVNGKSREPSSLWALIEEALDACGAQRVRWTGSEKDERRKGQVAGAENTSISRNDAKTQDEDSEVSISNSGGNADACALRLAPFDSDAVLSARAVEQYMRCPRQFYYQRVLTLPAQDEESAYSAFQECVWSVIQWAREERQAGRDVRTEAAARRLDEAWENRGPGDHPHAPILRARAGEMVERYCTFDRETTEPAAFGDEVVAELPAGRIRVRLDGVRETENGGLRVERYDTGRPADEDHREPRLALMREAARQARAGERPVEVVIRYLSTGDQKDVPEKPRYDRPRVGKYDEALRGIREGVFPAHPSDDHCPRCPFFFICPS